jgi:hypothetical protein
MDVQKKRLAGRRKFLAGVSSLAIGSLFFGYKALSKNTASTTDDSMLAEIAAANITPKPTPKPNARMGINFSGIAYWASELPFADLMRQSSEWVSQPPSGNWGTGPALKLDEEGWVKALEKDCYVTKILCSGDNVVYPSGTYVMYFEGEGEFELLAPIGVIRKVAQGKLEIDVDAKKGMFAINITSINPKNHLRHIRVIAPGLESSYQDNPWHPAFLKRWSGVACVRVMDMMATNHSTQMHWQDRPKPTDISYAKKGVPVELLVDLANRLETDVWFCMPHLVTDDFIKQFAMVVKNNLNPKLHAWVEYSNELWNGSFDQYAYAAERGQQLSLSKNLWEGAFLFNAKRSVEIFKIWETVFGEYDRLVRVIASQASNAWHSFQLLKAPEVLNHIDVLAIAPYIAMNIPIEADEGVLFAAKVAKWNLNQVFDYINKVALPDANRWINENKQVADAFGVKLVAYEAGQHLVGVAGAEKNERLTKLLIAANHDKRMGEVYANYMQHWLIAGGDLMCLFNSTEIWSPHGSWGLLQHYNDSVASSPKFKAVMNWAKSRGQKVSD